MGKGDETSFQLGVLFSREVSSMLIEIAGGSNIAPRILLEDAIKMMHKNYQNKKER